VIFALGLRLGGLTGVDVKFGYPPADAFYCWMISTVAGESMDFGFWMVGLLS